MTWTPLGAVRMAESADEQSTGPGGPHAGHLRSRHPLGAQLQHHLFQEISTDLMPTHEPSAHSLLSANSASGACLGVGEC